jgi:hypothetical protein
MQGGSMRRWHGWAADWCGVGGSAVGGLVVVWAGDFAATLHDDHSIQLVFVM